MIGAEGTAMDRMDCFRYMMPMQDFYWLSDGWGDRPLPILIVKARTFC